MGTILGEGIVLRVIPFSDFKKILTVFFPEEGVISLSARVISTSLSPLTAATSPLARSEFVFRKGKGDIYKLIEASLLNAHLPLRSCIKRLHCAGEILQLLLQTQLPGKPAPLLYELTKAYFHRLQESPSPENLMASFFLKFLKHEGLFLWTAIPFFPFKKEEWDLIGNLVSLRSFHNIEKLDLPENFALRIKEKLLLGKLE